MDHDRSQLEIELQKVERAIATQEGLRGILTEEQIEMILTALHGKRLSLQRQLGRSNDIAPKQNGPADSEHDMNGAIAGSKDRNVVVLITKTASGFWNQFNDLPLTLDELCDITERYLALVVDRYRYLDFRGMGLSDRIPLRMPLMSIYVPLKARFELLEGETWAREINLAGHHSNTKKEEAISQSIGKLKLVDQLLRENDGLVVLGDPGAGKTTFLKYLALRSALGGGEELGLGQRLPILIPLSAYAADLAIRDQPLERFIARYYRDQGIHLPIGPMLKAAIDRGGILLLLDGLDEVKALGQRELVMRRLTDFFNVQRRRGNRCILTSRIVGYREVRTIAEEWSECTLVDLEEEDTAEFVEKWTRTLEWATQRDKITFAKKISQERSELLKAMHHNSGARQLARNPLLLTMMLLMRLQSNALPERRIQLYERYVETALTHWNRVRAQGRPASPDLDVMETMRILAPLALWMHETGPEAGLVKREELRKKLEEIFAHRNAPKPGQAARQFLDDINSYLGILLEQRSGQYGFIHLTFQEFLAAVALAQAGQEQVEPVIDMLAVRASDDDWREVVLLTIEYIGIIQQRHEAASHIIYGLLVQSSELSGRPAVVVGDAVADIWPGGVTEACREVAIGTLLSSMRDDELVEPPVRVAAGDTLARLGDPRFRANAWYLSSDPLLDFVEVPAGPFLMGSREEDVLVLLELYGGKRRWYESEMPQHSRELPRYYIARYPVTVAQFRAFVESSNHKPRNPDCMCGIDNHPVRYVTWNEARAYCQWLTKTLRKWNETPEPLASLLRVGGWIVQLPNEAEWEKAARGTDGREFPWGNQPDPNRANFRRTGIGTTCTVGCFPGGASPYGCEDMAGNVWEWCATKWEKSYSGYQNDNNPKGEASRIVRGGSFNSYEDLVRCAARFSDNPDGLFRFGGFRVVIAPNFPSSTQ